MKYISAQWQLCRRLHLRNEALLTIGRVRTSVCIPDCGMLIMMLIASCEVVGIYIQINLLEYSIHM